MINSGVRSLRASARPVRTRADYRGDIDGLRAIAVALVIAGHFFGVPRGGYVGVDVFFVISGFLITSVLLRERFRTGRIQFGQFYARRIRRLLPAASVTLAVTVLASSLIFMTARAQQTATDASWALAFLANVHFADLGTDYFSAARPPSPLQHYWSLAVEEQFYLVWPALLALLLLTRARRRVVPIAIATVIVASLAWSVWATSTDPVSAYFSTLTRSWELGIGALLACQRSRLAALGPRLALALGIAGLAAIGAAAFAFDATTAFPGSAALLPVLGAAAVLAASEREGTHVVRRALSLGPMQYVGRLSYSLYLWHWPSLILTEAALGDGRWVTTVIALLATVALSVACYHLVEQPVRRSSWLSPRPARAAAHARLRPRPAQWAVAALPLALLAFGGASAAWYGGHRAPAAPDAVRPAVLAGAAAEANLRASVRAALVLDQWPADLRPSLASVATAGAPEWVRDDCLDVDRTNVDRCVYGAPNAKRLAVVLGDSMAISWVPALRSALAADTWRIRPLTWRQCPLTDVTTWTTIPTKPNLNCERHKRWAVEQVHRLNPDLIVVSNSYRSLTRTADGDGLPLQERWAAGFARSLRQVGAPQRQIVVLSPPPRSGNLQHCASRLGGPRECVLDVMHEWRQLRAAELPTARALGATYVDTSPWFCA
ncbi:MAG TPA: acyltransferase family protein, partial [Mycobacteriales bacterium]|nr:acyltransferase family protein [Mycobacteriales bacterium]